MEPVPKLTQSSVKVLEHSSGTNCVLREGTENESVLGPKPFIVPKEVQTLTEKLQVDQKFRINALKRQNKHFGRNFKLKDGSLTDDPTKASQNFMLVQIGKKDNFTIGPEFVTQLKKVINFDLSEEEKGKVEDLSKFIGLSMEWKDILVEVIKVFKVLIPPGYFNLGNGVRTNNPIEAAKMLMQ